MWHQRLLLLLRLLSKPLAIGLLRPWVGGGASPAMAGDSDDGRLRPAEDLEPYVHFLCSLGASVQNDRYSCLLYLYEMYLYVYVSFVGFLNV